MKPSRKVVTQQSQALTFTRRALVLGWAQAGVAALLAGRTAWLAIAENERYRTLAESNRVQMTIIPPRRGWIVDRYGKPIALNRNDFRVDILPSRLKDEETILARLQEILNLPPDEMERIREELQKAPDFRPVQVASNLNYEHFVGVSLRVPELPGVAPASGTARYYPTGAAVAHLVGYVGPASPEDYQRTRDPLLVTPGFKIGKDGLERTMESWLRGKPGAKRSEVTARGKLVRELTTRPETVGQTLQLNIDIGLQEYAARRLGTHSGSVVVMDTLTGEMLAMCSMPAFDPNSFSDGISHSEWNMFSADERVPLMNKVLQGLYPPGSTIKPMTALALLGAGIDPEMRVNCSGVYRVGSGRFHCWRRGGHGAVNMRQAIAQSCDVYFYHLGRQIGIDRIAPVARELGLGQEFPLPFPSQRYGTVPDSVWKKRKYRQDWTVADTVNATIGQGYMLANPLQLAVMAARLASGRKLMPRVIRNRRYGPPGDPLSFPQEHLDIVRQGMAAVVNGGTASRSQLQVPGVALAGKTGTAQVRRITKADRARGGSFGGHGVPWKYRDHALFVAYAPVENPRYAASVIIEHGISGSGVAGPIARDVLTYLYDAPRALQTLARMEQDWGGDIPARMRAETARWQADRLAAQTPEAAPGGNE